MRILIIIGALLALLGSALLLKDEAPSEFMEVEGYLSSPFDAQAEYVRWRTRIQQAEAETAYEEMKTAYLDSDVSSQHFGAHVFGEILYEEIGMDGISVCDDAFAFGCYHAFLLMAFLEESDAEMTVQTVLAECGKARACRHGIGHGLLAYFGGQEDGIEEALSLCPETGSLHIFEGCPAGVFMEYYWRVETTEKGSAFAWRKFDEERPYGPCPGVGEAWRNICYAQLPLWWDAVLYGDYETMGSLCDNIPAPQEQESCFLGLGMFAATRSEYDVPSTRTKCLAMPEPQGEFLCRSGAFLSFLGYTNSRETASRLCKGLPQDGLRRCLDTQPSILHVKGA